MILDLPLASMRRSEWELDSLPYHHLCLAARWNDPALPDIKRWCSGSMCNILGGVSRCKPRDNFAGNRL